MVSRNRTVPFLVGLMTVLLATAFLLRGGQGRAGEEEPADTNAFAEQDAGLDTIDVSGYPEEMQEKYEVVKEKCTHCHPLARVINSKYAMADEWKRYIKRMRRKPGAKIKKKQAKQIWEFLVYDSQQRKSDLIKQKQAEADSASNSK